MGLRVILSSPLFFSRVFLLLCSTLTGVRFSLSILVGSRESYHVDGPVSLKGIVPAGSAGSGQKGVWIPAKGLCGSR